MRIVCISVLAATFSAARAQVPVPDTSTSPKPSAPPSRPIAYVNGAIVIPRTPPLTPEQQRVVDQARAVWQARCRPTMVEDSEGVRRAIYAESDCDASEFNTAGED